VVERRALLRWLREVGSDEAPYFPLVNEFDTPDLVAFDLPFASPTKFGTIPRVAGVPEVSED
jgi:hypothetical protein